LFRKKKWETIKQRVDKISIELIEKSLNVNANQTKN